MREKTGTPATHFYIFFTLVLGSAVPPPWGCFIFFNFYFLAVPCGILVTQAGIEPVPPALEAWSLNHWTAKKSLGGCFKSTDILTESHL